MADNQILETTQLTLNKLSIITKIGEINISGLFQEMNLYDSIFAPCMSGTILVVDAIGLSNKLSFDGSEFLVIHAGKTKDELTVNKSFRIYKQSQRKNINLTSESYILHFISDEFLFSQQVRVSKSYKSTYSQMVENILESFLGVTGQKRAFIEKSIGNKKIIIPNMKPIDAIDWLAKKAINEKQSPTYLFFENKLGYNFVTVSTMIAQPPKFSISFQPKNVNLPDKELLEFNGARAMEIVSQFDYNRNITSGVYANSLYTFDYVTRTYVKITNDFSQTYNLSEHANRVPNIGVVDNKAGIKNTQMFNSRVLIFPSGLGLLNSDYVKKNDPTSIDSHDDSYRYILQRTALFKNLVNLRLKFVMPGNFDYISGITVDDNIHNISSTEKNDAANNIDRSISGKYLVVASRQIIKPGKHETIIEVATDSTNREDIFQSTDTQENYSYYGY